LEKWYCFKDKTEMLSAEIPLRYLNITHTIKGLRCPICGASYLTEDVVEKVRGGEEELEVK
jgi:hypothetical protein